MMKYILLISVLFSFALGQEVWVRSGNGKVKLRGSSLTGDSVTIPATVTSSGNIASKPNMHFGANGLIYKSTDTTSSGGSTDSAVYATLYNMRQMLDSIAQLKDKRMAQELANAGATTLATIGFAAASTKTGTVTTADDANGIFQKHRTTSASGNSAGWLSAFTLTKTDWLPEFNAYVQLYTGAVTNSRYWVGLFSATPVASGVPNVHALAFRYDTGVDGTAFWRTVSIAGTGASANVTTTTIAVAINTAYKLRIVVNTTSKVSFYINNVLVAVHTSTLPTSSTLLGYGCQVTTLTTGPHNIRVSRISIQQK